MNGKENETKAITAKQERKERKSMEMNGCIAIGSETVKRTLLQVI